jgi:hypothetical protein
MQDEKVSEDLKRRREHYALRVIRMFAALPKTEVARVLGRQFSLFAHLRPGSSFCFKSEG